MNGREEEQDARGRHARRERGLPLPSRVSLARVSLAASFFLASITSSRLFKHQVTTGIKYCKVNSTPLQENG